MHGLPFVNPALAVEAVGFAPWEGRWLGVMVTPWFINLVLAPLDPAQWRSLGQGEKRRYRFPAGDYEFIGAIEPGRRRIPALFAVLAGARIRGSGHRTLCRGARARRAARCRELRSARVVDGRAPGTGSRRPGGSKALDAPMSRRDVAARPLPAGRSMPIEGEIAVRLWACRRSHHTRVDPLDAAARDRARRRRPACRGRRGAGAAALQRLRARAGCGVRVRVGVGGGATAGAGKDRRALVRGGAREPAGGPAAPADRRAEGDRSGRDGRAGRRRSACVRPGALGSLPDARTRAARPRRWHDTRSTRRSTWCRATCSASRWPRSRRARMRTGSSAGRSRQ